MRPPRSWEPSLARGGKPILFTNLKSGEGLDGVIDWIRHAVLFEPVS